MTVRQPGLAATILMTTAAPVANVVRPAALGCATAISPMLTPTRHQTNYTAAKRSIISVPKTAIGRDSGARRVTSSSICWLQLYD